MVAELKREYKLEGFYGMQNLPAPNASHVRSLPVKKIQPKTLESKF